MSKKFGAKRVYMYLKEDYPIVEWRKTLYNNIARPRVLFVFWLARHNQLKTKDKLQRFGMIDNVNCYVIR